ncbi:MAG: efflux RND transporter periplasmic adaptor subunit [Anaerolineales bacterium]
MSQKKNNLSRWLIGAGVVVVVGVAGALLLSRVLRPRAAAGQTVQTAEVSAITAISRVETLGTVQPLQLANLAWKTTGQVMKVNVKVGNHVKAGDVLMELDPLSAPANVIGAQADLINAQTTLDNLLTPKQTDIANAQKAVADAQDTLAAKQRTLRNTKSPDVAYYTDQVNRAQESFTAAQQNAEITNFATSLKSAEDALEKAKSDLDYYTSLEAQYPGYSQQRGNVLERAQTTYDNAVASYQTALYNFQQSQAKNGNSVNDAQENLDTAKANLAAAKAGPDAIELAKAEAEFAVAEAKLAEAQETLNELLSGADPADVAVARARVQSAQATVDQLVIKAPFDGEVLSVNYRLGDLVGTAQTAIVLANRSELYVDVQVDETDVARIQTGDAVTLTLDSLVGSELIGAVENINPVGQTVSGLVKYTVRVSVQPLAGTPIFLGGTANATIVTDVQADVLAVPLDAIQSDDEGEYVNRVNTDGTRTRINLRSGALEGDLVTVSGGGLQKGDKVELVAAQPSNPVVGPFGGGN